MDDSGLREKAAEVFYSISNAIQIGTMDDCYKYADRILALVEAEYRPLLEDTLAVLECGVDPGPHHMDSIDGRAAWIDRMKPVRERLRAALATMEEEP